jgi:hypothetical protein
MKQGLRRVGTGAQPLPPRARSGRMQSQGAQGAESAAAAASAPPVPGTARPGPPPPGPAPRTVRLALELGDELAGLRTCLCVDMCTYGRWYVCVYAHVLCLQCRPPPRNDPCHRTRHHLSHSTASQMTPPAPCPVTPRRWWVSHPAKQLHYKRPPLSSRRAHRENLSPLPHSVFCHRLPSHKAVAVTIGARVRWPPRWLSA